MVVPSYIAWCGADARGQVVWFTTEHGLSVFDLVDRKVHPIFGTDLGQLEVIVDWGNQKLGGESQLAFDVGIAIHLRGTPKLEMAMGCDGDRSYYCYEDDGKRLLPAVVALQAKARALKLVDPAYVATLATRGASGSLWTPPPMPPIAPTPPKIDRAQCTEDEGSCGELTAIPANPLWLVITANSRGDFFHEDRELWDPATGEFLRVEGAKLVRTKAIPTKGGAHDYGGLRAAPSGALSYRGAVFDARTVLYAAREDAKTCGFVPEGGWRIAGASDL